MSRPESGVTDVTVVTVFVNTPIASSHREVHGKTVTNRIRHIFTKSRFEMMTLLIQPYLKTRRHYLQKKLNSSRKQLIEAYKSEDPRRIMKGKLTLARILRELAESPELGPKRLFQWGQLEVVYQFGFDPQITWAACEATESNMQKVAQLLESSIAYE